MLRFYLTIAYIVIIILISVICLAVVLPRFMFIIYSYL